jgi:ADP-heptose:LPS heptosyltransferase
MGYRGAKGTHISMKILLVDLLYIGDMLFTTPAIRMLKTAFPEAQIDVMMNQLALPVLQHHPLLRRVISFDTSTKQGHGKRLLRQIAALRREHYDLAICLHGDNERASLLTGLCGATQRSGYAKRGLCWLFTRRSSPVIPSLYQARGRHIAEEYLDLLEIAGVPRQAHRGLEMWADAAAEAQAAQLWDAAGLAGNTRVVGLNTGASFPTKRWRIDHFARLSDLLLDKGFTPVFFGAANDVPRVEEIRAAAAMPAISLAGKTTLLQLLPLLRRCAVVIPCRWRLHSKPRWWRSSVRRMTAFFIPSARDIRSSARISPACAATLSSARICAAWRSSPRNRCWTLPARCSDNERSVTGARPIPERRRFLVNNVTASYNSLHHAVRSSHLSAVPTFSANKDRSS